MILSQKFMSVFIPRKALNVQPLFMCEDQTWVFLNLSFIFFSRCKAHLSPLYDTTKNAPLKIIRKREILFVYCLLRVKCVDHALFCCQWASTFIYRASLFGLWKQFVTIFNLSISQFDRCFAKNEHFQLDGFTSRWWWWVAKNKTEVTHKKNVCCVPWFKSKRRKI